MDITTIFTSILTGGLATTIAVQLLKSQFLPFIKAELHPRITAAIVSVVASVLALLQSGVSWDQVTASGWVTVVGVFAGVLLVASATYNHVIKQPEE